MQIRNSQFCLDCYCQFLKNDTFTFVASGQNFSNPTFKDKAEQLSVSKLFAGSIYPAFLCMEPIAWLPSESTKMTDSAFKLCLPVLVAP